MNASESGVRDQRAKSEGSFGLRFSTVAMILSVVVFVVGAIIAAASLFVSASFKAGIAQSGTLMSSMRDHMTADMMHDSMRGVVFRAMYAAVNADTAMLEEARAEVDEYGATFTGALEAQTALDLPPSVRSVVEGVAVPLEAYLASTRDIVDKAMTDVAGAKADLTGFDASFKALEGKMSEVSDAIEAANIQLSEVVVGSSRIADVANWGGLAIILVLSLAIALLANPLIAKPLEDAIGGLTQLAAGDLNVAPIRSQCHQRSVGHGVRARRVPWRARQSRRTGEGGRCRGRHQHRARRESCLPQQGADERRGRGHHGRLYQAH